MTRPPTQDDKFLIRSSGRWAWMGSIPVRERLLAPALDPWVCTPTSWSVLGALGVNFPRPTTVCPLRRVRRGDAWSGAHLPPTEGGRRGRGRFASSYEMVTTNTFYPPSPVFSRTADLTSTIAQCAVSAFVRC
jgi:hypothetical protein